MLNFLLETGCVCSLFRGLHPSSNIWLFQALANLPISIFCLIPLFEGLPAAPHPDLPGTSLDLESSKQGLVRQTHVFTHILTLNFDFCL